VSDIIRLLPDSIANQIAAGEVIQRPASVVKELLENSIDAGATSIQVIVKNSGKTSMQVIDNGCGMSATDARMCFEKHATSKITKAEDLFNIRTMGFRGEALASVAAVAQVEMKTKLHDQEAGTLIEIEGSKVVRQVPCQTAPGTSIAVKNLFFNVPARRNFLKSDHVEWKYIIEEFTRAALAHPRISFRLFHNDSEVYYLRSANLKQRIVQLMGDAYTERIVPVEEKSYSLHVFGFIGKPNYAKKSRGEQYLFVNHRYIKSPYIHHAVIQAYSEMLSKDHFPFYVLFLEIDPSRIDINVHPQKYEVKFQDEKMVYTFVNLGVKHSLGAYSIAPTLDFNQEHHLNLMGAFTTNNFADIELITQTPEKERTAKKYAPPEHFPSYGASLRNWNMLQPASAGSSFEVLHRFPSASPAQGVSPASVNTSTEGTLSLPSQRISQEALHPHQLHNRYIVSQIKSGIIFIDQQAAHERILYERYSRLLKTNRTASQRQLFPQAIQFSPQDALLLKEILPDIQHLGFEINEFGENAFVIHAFPADVHIGNERQVLEELLEQYKNQLHISNFSKREKLAQALSVSSSIKAGKVLSVEEMQMLIDELFACENPYHAPNGRCTIIILSLDELQKRFGAKK
jgi:DNA mismatch repair protein MutL